MFPGPDDDDTVRRVHVHITITKSLTTPIPLTATTSPGPIPIPTPGPLAPIEAWLDSSIPNKDLQVPLSCNRCCIFPPVTCFPQLSINQVVTLYLANKEGSQDVAWALVEPFMEGVLEVWRDCFLCIILACTASSTHLRL